MNARICITENSQPNQWEAMQSLVHSSWQTQHQCSPQPGLLQIMCMQPPSLSVGVLQPGQGLEMILMVRVLGSAPALHLCSAAVPGCAGTGWQGRHSPRWAPSLQSLQNTKPQSAQPTLLQSGEESVRIPAPHPGCGQRTPPDCRTSSSAPQVRYLAQSVLPSSLTMIDLISL